MAGHILAMVGVQGLLAEVQPIDLELHDRRNEVTKVRVAGGLAINNGPAMREALLATSRALSTICCIHAPASSDGDGSNFPRRTARPRRSLGGRWTVPGQ